MSLENGPVFSRQWGIPAILAILTVATLAAGCGNSSPTPASPTGISIKASDTDCQVASTLLDSGTQTFNVSNAGSQVTEVFVYATGDRVVGDVANIGPSTSKRLTVALKPGQYQVSCSPGMVGKNIRTPITVKGPSGTPSAASPQLDAAVAGYRSYVVAQAALLESRTKRFVAAIQAGEIPKAQSLYAPARIPYETIEPVVESMGDLDPRIDARIDDVEVGQTWTGFHRLEHDLWQTADISVDGPIAAQLNSDVAKLVDQIRRVDVSAAEIGNVALTLMQGVAASKITGEEERYSSLDLVDVSAGVEGSQVAYAALRSFVYAINPNLVFKLDARYAALKEELAQYGSGSSFELYNALTKAQIDALRDDVSALLGPLGQLSSLAQKA